jgi:hypothetical protein
MLRLLTYRRDLQNVNAKIGRISAQGWVGKVEDLRTENDGEAGIAIKLMGSGIVIKTWNNSFSDSDDFTMIRRNDSLYPSLMNISDGDQVIVSGTFIPGSLDFIR